GLLVYRYLENILDAPIPRPIFQTRRIKVFLYEVVVNKNYIQQFAHEKKFSKGEFVKTVEKCSKGIDFKDGDLALTKITNTLVEDYGFRDRGPFWELKVKHVAEIGTDPSERTKVI